MDKNTAKLHRIDRGIFKNKKSEISKAVSEAAVIDNTCTYQLYFDGGSRFNGSKHSMAGAGYVIKAKSGDVLLKGWKYMGGATNNQAEYEGLIQGLESARKLGIRKLSCFGDSLLVINQMKGTWKIKNEVLKRIYNSMFELQQSFDSLTYTHVYREHNKEADELANKAMDTGMTGVFKILE